MGLYDIGCNIGDTDNDLTKAMLLGNFDSPPADLDEDSSRRWEMCKTWSNALRNQGALLPSDIKGVDNIRDLNRFQALLCPYQLSNENMIMKTGEDEKAELREKTEAEIVRWLEKHGF